MDITANMEHDTLVDLETISDEDSYLATYLTIDSISEDERNVLAHILKRLKPYGFNMSIHHRVTGVGFSTNVMCLSLDTDLYTKRAKRNAGRKKDALLNEKYTPCTVSELKEKLDTMKQTQIIAELGCPRCMFYRVLRNLRQLEQWDNNTDSIWWYTV